MTGPVPLHVISGKGGTGKTSVAVALAHALARAGHQVLVCEVEQRHGLTELLSLPPLELGTPRPLFRVGTGAVSGLSVDARPALQDYLDTHFHLGVATRLLERAGFVEFATMIAPGLRDVLLVGKVYQAARLRMKGVEDHFDVVILDAPPTGRLHTFLTAGDALADLVKVGPIRDHALEITQFLRAPETRIHLVTTPRELAVTETLAALADLVRLDMGVGRVIVNMVRAVPPELGTVAGVGEQLLSAYAAERELALTEERWLRVLTERPGESVQLPLLPDEIGRTGVRQLGDALAKHWVAR